MIGRILLHYRIVEHIGAGGMGVVYKAWDEHLDRTVAIKMLPSDKTSDPERRRRFVQEAKAASALNDPHIVTIHDIASDNDVCFIVMEFVPGEPLSQVITRGPMDLADVVRYGSQIAGALSKAHELGIVHRDLKPANVLITPDKRAKVLDFGLAKLMEAPREQQFATVTLQASEHTAAGTILGTAGYMSPEQIQAQMVDGRSDIFSLGVVLYEMLTGRRPFTGESSIGVMAAILHSAPAPPGLMRNSVPAELERIVFACLEKNPELRIQTSAEVRDALELLRLDTSRNTLTRSHIAPPVPSIAVLPFNNLSTDKENEYFCEGLAEEIINELTRRGKLRVTARASAFAFRGPSWDVDKIAAKLKVDYVLEGGVRKVQNRMRVTVNLVKVADGFQVWSERFDREMTDIFEIQDEISAAVVNKLHGQLTSEFSMEPKSRRQPRDIEAYKLYLKGRFFWNRRSWPNLRRGIDCFTEALAIDPLYADAYTGLADSFNLLGYYNERPPKVAFASARAAAERALELDEHAAGAHASLGYTSLFFDWDWPKADREFRRAVELDPDNARGHHWQAWYYFVTRQYKEAIACMQRAHERDPLAPIVNDHLGLSYLLAGQHGKALQQLGATIDVDPDFFLAHYRIGWVHLHVGAPERAVSPLERAVQLSDGKIAAGMLGLAYALTGREREARKTLAVVTSEAASRYVSPLERSLIHAGLGDLDGAFRFLDAAVEDRVSDLVLLLSYPWPRAIRSDARLQRVAQRIGLLGNPARSAHL